MNNKKILIFTLFLILMFSPFSLLAQDYTPLAPLPELAPGGNDGSFAFFVQNSFYLAIGIAGVLAVIMIMIGGIQYMTTDAIGGKQEGKERITKALLGLFLAIGAWLILNTINPGILNLNLSVDDVPPPDDGNTETTYTRFLTKFDYTGSENDCSSEIVFQGGGFGRFETEVECREFIKTKFNSSEYPYETGPPMCDVWSCVKSN